MSKRVVVAMSGGVDSSVAAALLLQEGWQVEGVFMKNWSPDSLQALTDCPWEQDQVDAEAVCRQLGIPFRSLNFEREYRERVVEYFLREYEAGRTPNPDVMCNKEIKFDLFLREAVAQGADMIATGHYARIEEVEGSFYIVRGADSRKDQSYFLYTLQDEQLRRTIFPLGNLEKEQVRQLARQFGLPTAEKKDSQGICFIGHIDLKRFLAEHLPARPGSTYLLPPYQNGQGWEERKARSVYIGGHQGSAFYTIGERAGNSVDNGLYRRARGSQEVPPLYVLDKDSHTNVIYVTDQREDPHFRATCLYVEGWTGPLPAGQPLDSPLTCQIRYQQRESILVEAMQLQADGRVAVRMAGPAYPRAIAAGQSLVVYQDYRRILGGGIVVGFERMEEDAIPGK